MRKAAEGLPFCSRHGDAIFGATLGALLYEKPVKKGETRAGRINSKDKSESFPQG
jgi:hypothetical protein